MLRESSRAVVNETAGMTADMESLLLSYSDRKRAQLRRESVNALRAAWSQRHNSFRAPLVIRANVRMLRNLRTIS